MRALLRDLGIIFFFRDKESFAYSLLAWLIVLWGICNILEVLGRWR